MLIDEAKEKVINLWLPVCEQAFGCRARLDEDATEEFDWGWVFTFRPQDGEPEDQRVVKKRKYLFSIEHDRSCPVGPRGVMYSLQLLAQAMESQ